MTLDERIQGMRWRGIQRAAELGSAAAACREAGISRTLFYRWRRRLERCSSGMGGTMVFRRSGGSV